MSVGTIDKDRLDTVSSFNFACTYAQLNTVEFGVSSSFYPKYHPLICMASRQVNNSSWHPHPWVRPMFSSSSESLSSSSSHHRCPKLQSVSFEQFPRPWCLSSSFFMTDESPSSRNSIAVSQTIGGRLRTCGRARAACAASTFYCAAPETLRQQRAQLRNTVRPGYV